MNTSSPNQRSWTRPKDRRVDSTLEEWSQNLRRRLWQRVSSLARHQQIAIKTVPCDRTFVLFQGEWSRSFSANCDGLEDAYTLLERMVEI